MVGVLIQWSNLKASSFCCMNHGSCIYIYIHMNIHMYIYMYILDFMVTFSCLQVWSFVFLWVVLRALLPDVITACTMLAACRSAPNWSQAFDVFTRCRGKGHEALETGHSVWWQFDPTATLGEELCSPESSKTTGTPSGWWLGSLVQREKRLKKKYGIAMKNSRLAPGNWRLGAEIFTLFQKRTSSSSNPPVVGVPARI